MELLHGSGFLRLSASEVIPALLDLPGSVTSSGDTDMV